MDSAEQKMVKFSKEMANYYMILTCFRYIFLIMALASNLVVCMAMVKTKDHRKTLSKFFIFQLAVVDVAFRILECYELISERVTDGALGLTHCKIIVFVQYICAAVIFSLLAGIALDRSKNIIYPLQSFKTRSYNHRKKALLLIWLCSIAVSAGFLLTATSVRFSRRFGAAGNRNSSISRVKTNVSGGEFLFQSPKSFCIAGPPNSLETQISFMSYFLCGFFIPFCIMAICYSRVFYFLKDRGKKSILNQSVIKSKWKTVIILMLLVLNFLVSWGPIMTLELFASFISLEKETREWLRPPAEVICLSSSILNPIIYAFADASFRKQTVSLLTCKRRISCLKSNL